MFLARRVWSPLGALGSILALSAAPMAAPSPASAETVRHTLSGDRVAIHNLVGEFTVVPTTGASVVAEVTLRGADAGRLQIQAGTLRGANTLRIVYPDDRIVLPGLQQGDRSQDGRNGSATTGRLTASPGKAGASRSRTGGGDSRPRRTCVSSSRGAEPCRSTGVTVRAT